MSETSRSPSKPPLRVLTMGDNQSFFVALLCREIKRHYPHVEFDICDYIQYGKNVTYEEEKTFGHQFVSPPVFDFSLQTARAVAGVFFSGHLYRRMARTTACFGLAGRSRFDAAARSLGKAVQIQRFRNEVLNRHEYDVWHFHYLTPSSVRYMDVVPKNIRVLCSFWGSDLLRAAGPEAYVPVAAALNRADAITVQNVELKEVILAKFGRHLKRKIHCCLFPADGDIYTRIASFCQDGDKGRKRVRQMLKLPENRTLIGIGHNGGSADRHLEIVAELAQLPEVIKKRLFLVFPMTYIFDKAHAAKVEEATKRAGLDFYLLKDYLDRDELAALRVALDITIFMPESDAMSGTALETIYAGNTLVAGVWQPYGLYRRLGLPYVELENYGDLQRVIPTLLERRPESWASLQKIQARIQGAFLADATVPAWVDVLRLLEQPRKS